MPAMEFQVCYRSREARWVVTLGNSLYGAYLDKEQALLDAVDAARDALEVGREAQVWLREQQSPARVFWPIAERQRHARGAHPTNLNWYSLEFLLRMTRQVS